MYFIVNEKGIITSVNPYGASHLGYTPEDLIGRTFVSLVYDRDLKNAEEELSRIISTPGKVFHKELRKIKSDGTVLKIHEIGRAVTGPDGKPTVFFVNEDITERKYAEKALNRANKKLYLLNAVTFNDIQNAIFCLSGYIDLERIRAEGKTDTELIEKESGIIRTITKSLISAKNFQNLGLKPPVWQDIHQTFLFGISHLDMQAYSRIVQASGLQIFADPLLETVFYTLADNSIRHAKTAKTLIVRYEINPDANLTLYFEDDGEGIPETDKEKIFEREYHRTSGMGLYLIREILAITDISIQETGKKGEGARFEMKVPHDGYRFTQGKEEKSDR